MTKRIETAVCSIADTFLPLLYFPLPSIPIFLGQLSNLQIIPAGFGYSLNDDSIGVVFNDLTKLLLLADGQNIHYIDYDGGEVGYYV